MDLILEESNSEKKSGTEKSCTDCKTTKTPLWRGGPAGPKSLCNACGIRHRKKRSILGLNKRTENKKGKEKSKSNSSNSNATTSASSGKNEGDENLRKSMKMGLMALGKEVVLLQRQRSAIVRRKRRRDGNGEEEQAAAMLMALSCGFVFA